MVIEKLLWTSGILAAIALLFRGSVILGLYLGVLPGLLLAVAPSVFAYSLAFVLLRAVLPIAPGAAANGAAAVLALALGAALAAPFAVAGRHSFAAADTGDVAPATPVRLAGHIRLERSGLAREDASSGQSVQDCDALCAALLETRGVLSVTLAGSDRSGAPLAAVTYRLVPKVAPPLAGLVPSHPERIVDHLPRPAPGAGGREWRDDFAETEVLRKAIVAHWGLRLASELTLVAEPPRDRVDQIIAISDTRPAGPHRIAVSEVELHDADGRVLLRRRRVIASPVAVPLHVVPEGPMMDHGFGIGRSNLHSGPRYFEFKPIETLFADTSLARPVATREDVARLRNRLAAAVGQPGRAGDMTLVEPWLATLDWRRLDEADIDLLGRLIVDPGVTGLERIYYGYAKFVSPRLRRPIILRLLDPETDTALRNNLDSLVRNMPPGTFANPLPEERALLRDRDLRLTSSALVARLSDQRAAAVPLLIALLREDVTVEPWSKRRGMMADLRRAFTRLGPDAASALPIVERLFDAPGMPLANEWREARDWRVAMVRMGKPIDSLRFPPNLTPEAAARDREEIRKQAARESQSE